VQIIALICWSHITESEKLNFYIYLGREQAPRTVPFLCVRLRNITRTGSDTDPASAQPDRVGETAEDGPRRRQRAVEGVVGGGGKPGCDIRANRQYTTLHEPVRHLVAPLSELAEPRMILSYTFNCRIGF
jgi:hypothetical protein